MTNILDGKQTAQQLNEQTQQRVTQFGQPIVLASVYDANNQGSKLYVGMKTKKAHSLGIETQEFQVDEQATTQSVIDLVQRLNDDPAINGILIQSPLPAGVDESQVLDAIAPIKDADGLSAINQGLLAAGSHSSYTPPATPAGVMELLAAYQIDVTGKQALVIGRSRLFGRPMAGLLNNANATVTLAHRYTPEATLNELLKTADIIVVGVGQVDFLTDQVLKPGVIVIDVGANKDANNHAVGDVNYEKVAPQTSYITPVPGGVGPMTVATLLKQTVDLAIRQNKNN